MLASLPRTAAIARPTAWIDKLTACATATTPRAGESTRRGWTVWANSSSAKRSTLLGATRTFPRPRSVFHSVEVVVCVIIGVGRDGRSWIHARGVMFQEKAPKRGGSFRAAPRRGGRTLGSRGGRGRRAGVGACDALPVRAQSVPGSPFREGVESHRDERSPGRYEPFSICAAPQRGLRLPGPAPAARPSSPARTPH